MNPKLVDYYYAQRQKDTDIADSYRTHHFKAYVEDARSRGYTSIPVLEFLKGKPWNNMALNFVSALRPSGIRVTRDEITSDAVSWRVTVYLEDDDRTIQRIEQEVSVGLIGCTCGHDVRIGNI